METLYTFGYSKPVVSGYMVHFEGLANRQYSIVGESQIPETLAASLIRRGAGALATAELLTVVFGSEGKRSKNILAMSSRIIKDYGEKSVMSVSDPRALSEKFDIPLPRAIQIVACAELGRRFYKKNTASAPIIRTAQDIVDYVGDMGKLSKEHLRGIYLNAHYKVIHEETIAIGTVDTSIIHPREVFRPALEYAATAVILVHNHPSGSLEASDADIAITKQLVEAGMLLGIGLVDHLIITRNSFASVPARYAQ
jgi:DNA repair protein RadC